MLRLVATTCIINDLVILDTLGFLYTVAGWYLVTVSLH